MTQDNQEPRYAMLDTTRLEDYVASAEPAERVMARLIATGASDQLNDWRRAEFDRGTEFGHVIDAMIGVVSSQIAALAVAQYVTPLRTGRWGDADAHRVRDMILDVTLRHFEQTLRKTIDLYENDPTTAPVVSSRPRR